LKNALISLRTPLLLKNSIVERKSFSDEFDQSNKSVFSKLSNENKYDVMSFFYPSDILSIRAVNHEFKSLIDSPYGDRLLFAPFLKLPENSGHSTYRDVFQNELSLRQPPFILEGCKATRELESVRAFFMASHTPATIKHLTSLHPRYFSEISNLREEYKYKKYYPVVSFSIGIALITCGISMSNSLPIYSFFLNSSGMIFVFFSACIGPNLPIENEELEIRSGAYHILKRGFSEQFGIAIDAYDDHPEFLEEMFGARI
jgi:hypothetical protein